MSKRICRTTNLTALTAGIALLVIPTAYAGTVSTNPGAQPVLGKAGVDSAQRHARFIVSYAKGSKLSAAAERQVFDGAAKTLGLSSIAKVRTLGTGAALITTSGQLDRDAIQRLSQAMRAQNSAILAVEPDIRVEPLLVPNDPRYAQQWHYRNGPGGINAEPAWDISTGSGVVVAVIDTGITNHADLAGQTIPGYDMISPDADGTFRTAADGDGRDADASDPGDWGTDCPRPRAASSWHGTHVAGTVGAATNNGVGVAGVAFGAKVQPVRALGKCGGVLSDLTDAIVWASGGTVPGIPVNPTPAEVLNLSLGSIGPCGPAAQQAVDGAVARGSTVVVAAGNSFADAEFFVPANCRGVVAVAAVDPSGTLSGYSNYGVDVSVAAPGGGGIGVTANDVLSTLNLGTTVPGADGYATAAGTSMASPHVAGIVALMQAAAPTPLPPAQVKRILENTALSANGATAGCNPSTKPCGAGIVDARMAVAVATGLEPLPADPVPLPLPPAVPLTNGVPVTGVTVPNRGRQTYSIVVPPGSTDLRVTFAGGSGDADMHMRRDARPTVSTSDCASTGNDSNEVCAIAAPQPGTYFIRLTAYGAVSGVTVTASYTAGQVRTPPADLLVRKQRSKTAVTWTGGAPRVDVYKNGAMWKTVSNSGVLFDSLRATAPPRFRVCNAGTQDCSNEVTRAD